MNEILLKGQLSNNAYSYLSQVMSLYQIYLQIKQEIVLLDRKILYLQKDYLRDSSQMNSFEYQNVLSERTHKETQLQQQTSMIANYMVLSTQNALQALQISIKSKDNINIMLDDGLLSSIGSFIELSDKRIIDNYKEQCSVSNISFLLSDIENKRIFTPLLVVSGFDRLRRIIRGF